jgi:hypothetical protein
MVNSQINTLYVRGLETERGISFYNFKTHFANDGSCLLRITVCLTSCNAVLTSLSDHYRAILIIINIVYC